MKSEGPFAMTMRDDLYSVIEDAKVSGLSAICGIGFGRLQFSIDLTLKATKDHSALIRNPIGFVWTGTTKAEQLLPLGNAVVETNWFSETKEHTSKDVFFVILELSTEKLVALERLRRSGQLFFRVDLHFLIEGRTRQLQRVLKQIWFEATLSEWSKILRDLGQLELLVLSVELPLKEAPKKLTTAIEQIREAHTDLIAGRYNSVVRCVRLALDSIDTIAVTGSAEAAARQAFAGNREVREGMSKRQRRDLVRAAIRHYTHPAHHVDSEGNAHDFSRHDATFILSSAASVIWEVIGSMKLDGNWDRPSNGAEPDE